MPPSPDPGDLLDAVTSAVRAIAAREIMPRYQAAAHSRKADGSLLTDADVAAQAALIEALPAIFDAPVLGEEMPQQQ